MNRCSLFLLLLLGGCGETYEYSNAQQLEFAKRCTDAGMIPDVRRYTLRCYSADKPKDVVVH